MCEILPHLGFQALNILVKVPLGGGRYAELTVSKINHRYPKKMFEKLTGFEPVRGNLNIFLI